MESAQRNLSPLDALFLERAYELAARALGSTAPNPPVGAVVVRDGKVVGEGYHHGAGEAHAEPNALAQAGLSARGATLYVSLEPCRHVGRTPPCANALIEAGVARVVAGTLDPSSNGGASELREHGIDVTVAGDPLARDLIEAFSVTTRSDRPFVALKMAMSLDGRIASRAGVREQIGSPAEARYVRDLRTTYDAVMVGAGTIRVDDPQLTVRPPHDRLRPYVRVIACGGDAVPARSRVFEALPGYDRTIALVPGGSSHRFDELRAVADVIEVGASDAQTLDLRDAMARLRAHGIFSVLCEGGPKLGASLLAASLVDRVYWAIAARLFGGDAAVPVLSGADLGSVRLRIDRVDRVDSDVVVSAAVASDV